MSREVGKEEIANDVLSVDIARNFNELLQLSALNKPQDTQWHAQELLDALADLVINPETSRRAVAQIGELVCGDSNTANLYVALAIATTLTVRLDAQTQESKAFFDLLMGVANESKDDDLRIRLIDLAIQLDTSERSSDHQIDLDAPLFDLDDLRMHIEDSPWQMLLNKKNIAFGAFVNEFSTCVHVVKNSSQIKEGEVERLVALQDYPIAISSKINDLRSFADPEVQELAKVIVDKEWIRLGSKNSSRMREYLDSGYLYTVHALDACRYIHDCTLISELSRNFKHMQDRLHEIVFYTPEAKNALEWVHDYILLGLVGRDIKLIRQSIDGAGFRTHEGMRIAQQVYDYEMFEAFKTNPPMLRLGLLWKLFYTDKAVAAANAILKQYTVGASGISDVLFGVDDLDD